MRKHNQIHTLGALHCKAHFGPKNTVVALPRTQKPVSECYVIERLIGTTVEWYEYCTLLHPVGGIHVIGTM